MDRNTLWGAAGGMVFEHPTSWDVQDRFNWVDVHCKRMIDQAVHAIRGGGGALALFNPANWQRSDPLTLSLGGDVGLRDVTTQQLPDGRALCQLEQPSLGLTSVATSQRPAGASRKIALPPRIETEFYSAAIDPNSGDLVSLRLKPSGHEVLGGPANALVAEAPQHAVRAGNHMLNRPQRNRLAVSGTHAVKFSVTTGPLATLVAVRSRFYGDKEARRVYTFYHRHRRIDFDTYLEDIPDPTVVVAEFPLAEDVTEVRRGIPYGFSHGAWPEPTEQLAGFMQGITPAVRWSAYTLARGPLVALLDRGLTGREINGRTPVIYLLNTTDKYNGYANPWLSGKGPKHLQYALVATEAPWPQARISRLAWEYNTPTILVKETALSGGQSLVTTSDNVIVQALRREESHIELRLVECLGRAGEAVVSIHLPHTTASLTNLLGKDPQPLPGGPEYRFDIRPQQIVTLRLRTGESVPPIEPLTDWSPLVPEDKREALKRYDPTVKGHPPHG